MKKENYFTPRMSKLSEQDLQEYIDHKDKYELEAVQAAIWELESREKITPQISEQIGNIEKEQKKEEDKILDAHVEITKEVGIPVYPITGIMRFVHSIVDGFLIYVLSLFIIAITPLMFAELVFVLLYPAYYLVFEYYLQQTPGKMMSGTLVIDSEGNKPNFQTFVLRTFIRYIPFEPFSCIGYASCGWHDRWTKTYVIKKEHLPKMIEILDKQE